jgi:dienelactone hydrolase
VAEAASGDGDNVPGVRKRAAVLGLLLLALVALSASPAVATKPAPRPTDFAVGFTTVRFDNQGRTLDTTVYYPATGRASTLTVLNAPRATKWGPYPMILFSHDLGQTTTPYARLLHAWAEAGYVVAVPTYAAPTDADANANGQVVVDLGERVTDASFVIDRMLDRVQGGFAAIVDRNRIGAAGHALGATITYALAFSSETPDPRISASVTIGGGVAGDTSAYFAGLETPLLSIHGDADTVNPIEGANATYALAGPPKFFVTLLGADGNSPFAKAGDPALRVVETTTLDFFDAYLRGRTSGLAQLARDGKVAEVAKIKAVLH